MRLRICNGEADNTAPRDVHSLEALGDGAQANVLQSERPIRRRRVTERRTTVSSSMEHDLSPRPGCEDVDASVAKGERV